MNPDPSKDDNLLQAIPALSGPQIAAVDALMGGATDGEAAKEAGVARSTVLAWRTSNPAFVAAMNHRRSEIFESGRARLLALIPAALDRIGREISDPDSPGGLRAAVRIIEAGITAGALNDRGGPTSPQEVLDDIARERHCDGVEGILADLDGGTVTDRARREALAALRASGAFEKS